MIQSNNKMLLINLVLNKMIKQRNLVTLLQNSYSKKYGVKMPNQVNNKNKFYCLRLQNLNQTKKIKNSFRSFKTNYNLMLLCQLYCKIRLYNSKKNNKTQANSNFKRLNLKNKSNSFNKNQKQQNRKNSKQLMILNVRKK